MTCANGSTTGLERSRWVLVYTPQHASCGQHKARVKLPKLPPKVKTSLQIAVSLLVLSVLLSRLDSERSLEVLREANPAWLLLVLALFALDRVLMAIKWRQLINLLGSAISRIDAILIYYQSNFVGFALPFGGLGPDIIRFLTMRSRGSDPHLVLSSIVMERVIGLIATAAVVLVSALVFAKLVAEPRMQIFALAIGAATAGGGLLIATIVFLPAAQRLITRVFGSGKKLEQQTDTEEKQTRLEKYVGAARVYSQERPALTYNLLLALIEQLIKVGVYYATARALSLPISLEVCLAVAPLASLAQRIPISYAGIGLREGAATALFVALGVDYSEALLLMLTQFIVFVISLLPGAIVTASSGIPRTTAET